MGVVDYEFLFRCWHTVCSLVHNVVSKKIGFPGWPEPNLDWVLVLGGQFKERGGLHQPPFSFSGCESLGWLVRGPVGGPVSLK